MSETLAIVSVSGGKDSTATALLALDEFGIDRCRFVFADTGNEHETTLAYINDYLPTVLGPIITLRADFTREIARRREYITEHWPAEGVTGLTIGTVLSVMQPTGNPFLDLCLFKGRFPSRMAQFCTQFLKRIPLDNYLLEQIGAGFTVESWRGIRRDESGRRRDALAREDTAEGYSIVHPIVAWDAQRTVDFVRARGVLLNPLYSQGMHRVGCMPCINCNKDELLEISKRFPEHVDRIRQWEALVSLAAKSGYASFFAGKKEHDAEAPAAIFERLRIDKRIEWANTGRGGHTTDLFRSTDEPEACSSIYGLCE